MPTITVHDIVALTQDIEAREFMTDVSILLRRGQVGTVVEEYDDGTAFEVEFSGSTGQPYALLAIPAEQLMPLYYQAVYLNPAS